MNSTTNQGRTLERALDIIECVEGARSPVKPSQIAKSTGLHLTTTQRITATLTRRGYLTATDAGFVLGPIVLAHAHAFVLQDRLTMVAYPVLAELTGATGLTSSVYVRNGHSRILLARVEAPHPLRYQFPIGQRLPLDVGAGKVLLAQMPDEDLTEYLEHYSDVTLADGSLQSSSTISKAVAAIRSEAYYISQAERYLGVISLSVPLEDSAGQPLGTLNLVSNEDTIGFDEMVRHRGLLRQAGRRIGEQL